MSPEEMFASDQDWCLVHQAYDCAVPELKPFFPGDCQKQRTKALAELRAGARPEARQECPDCHTDYWPGDRHACAAKGHEWTKEDPAYYRGRSGKFDIVEVIADFGLDFDLGCVAKYIFRAGKKPGSDFLIDLRKALRVLERRVERETAR